MSANPYKRQSNDLDSSMRTWDVASLVPAPVHSAACRIRWAARLACARLRVQVAEERCENDRALHVLSGCGWVLPELRAERDRARKVLAKLEKRDV